VNAVIHDFNQKLAFSTGVNMVEDMERIKHALHGCVSVDKTDIDTDKSGVDYYAYKLLKSMRNGVKQTLLGGGSMENQNLL